MPSTVNNKITIPVLQATDLIDIPVWAHSEYKKSHEVFSQLTTQIVKLENNIADLENMVLKEETPRSLRVKIEVKVKEPQQQAMDTALNSAKKIFEKSVLQALITARKAELTQLKAQADKKPTEFTTFLKNNFEKLKQNNVPLPDMDDDVDSSVQYATHKYNERAGKVVQTIHTLHFFNKQHEKEKKQAREAAAQERRINQELQDPAVKDLMERINKLESSVRQTSNRNNGNKKNKKQGKKQGNKQDQKNKPTGQSKKDNNKRPFRNRPRRNPNRTNNRRNVNQGRAQGNQGPQRRYTNTTNRSGSRPPNSRPRRN